MRHEFRLPDIGEGMSEGTLLEWAVSIGAVIEEGDTVAEVSTDKIDFEVPAPVSGKVLELPWSPGDVIPVGGVLMVIETGGGEMGPSGTASQSASAAISPEDPAPTDLRSSQQGIIASPVVRRRAAERGIALSSIAGSGPGGRILDEDLQSTQPAAHHPQEHSSGQGPGFRIVEVTGVRAVVARRMAESTRSAATSTTTFTVDASQLLADIQALSSDGLKVTPLSVIISAAAGVLKGHDRLNATVEPGGSSLRVFERVSIAVAIATADGLMVPVIRDADSLGVIGIARTLKGLSQRARTRSLTPEEAAGGTFTVSSTGGLERVNIVSTMPIINPPQTGTLWVSRITEQPHVVGGAVRVVPTMTASLSFDHRFVDGADATSFINDLVERIESGTANA